MNAYASVPSSYSIYDFPYAVMRAASAQMFDVITQSAQLAALPFVPYEIDLAVRQARENEKTRTTPFPKNEASSLGITSTVIGGKTVPVKVRFDHISSSCDLWRFSRPEHDDKPTILLPVPVSGSHPVVMQPLAAGLLPYRNVAVLGCVDPRNMPRDLKFGINAQASDVIKGLVHVSKSSRHGSALAGTSQSGVAVAIAAAVMAADPQKYKNACPSSLIFIGSPLDAQRGGNALNWLARYHSLPGNIFIRTREGREILPCGVMKALYGFTQDKLKRQPRLQDIDGLHLRQMHEWIFQNNLLARGKFCHEGETVNSSRYRGKLLTIAGGADGIVPPEQTHAAHEMFKGIEKSGRRAVTIKGAGHYDTIQEGPALDRVVSHIVGFTQPAAQPS